MSVESGSCSSRTLVLSSAAYSSVSTARVSVGNAAAGFLMAIRTPSERDDLPWDADTLLADCPASRGCRFSALEPDSLPVGSGFILCTIHSVSTRGVKRRAESLAM